MAFTWPNLCLWPWVVILCPAVVSKKSKKPKTLKNCKKNLGFYQPWSHRETPARHVLATYLIPRYYSARGGSIRWSWGSNQGF